MASRSWNHVELMGNLTRDPELRYTPNGTPVCSFGLATNWTYVSEGVRKENVDFHRVVAWNKLAELCSQLLKKGSRVFVSGRLQYREWETPEGQKRREAEVVIEDMIQLTPRNGLVQTEETTSSDEKTVALAKEVASPATPADNTDDTATPAANPAPGNENVSPDDLPF